MRAPRHPLQGLAAGVRAQQTLGAGNVANAGPIPEFTTAVAMAQQGSQSASEAGFWDEDIYTLATTGAQDLTLTYLPIDGSEHVEISGLKTKKGTHWTRDNQTLHLLTALGARVGEVVTVEYAYLTGLPGIVASLPDLNIPFQAAGWKYHELTSTGLLSSYVDPAFDDSAWSVGACPMGIGTYTDVDGHPKATTVPAGNTGGLGHVEDFVVRRLVGPGTGIVLTVDESNYVAVYVNGSLLTSASTGGALKFTAAVPDQLDPWLLAVYVTVANGATSGGVDLQVTGTDL